jgi:type III secretory pathway component EscU
MSQTPEETQDPWESATAMRCRDETKLDRVTQESQPVSWIGTLVLFVVVYFLFVGAYLAGKHHDTIQKKIEQVQRNWAK